MRKDDALSKLFIILLFSNFTFYLVKDGWKLSK